MSPCKSASCKSDPSSKDIFVQFYFRAILSPRAIFCARANLTATRIKQFIQFLYYHKNGLK